MMVLQNCEEPLSPNNDENVSVEDVTYLHGVDAENVTIKLIKKCENVNKEPDISDEDENEEPKPYMCTICDRGFYSDISLKTHTWQHNLEKSEKITCSTCLETFMNTEDLVTHLKEEHGGNGSCQICGRTFRSEKNYDAHMSVVHLPTNKSFTCKICGRSYNTWGALRTHSVAHSNDRPYQCDYCKKSFKRNQDLKFHINQHTGAKPYKCPFCEKSFASSGNCYSHRNRMHPGRRVESKPRRWNTAPREPATPRPIAPKPLPKNSLTVVKGIYKYQCPHCIATFVKRDNFTYHLYQHTGEKPFECNVCPEKFVTRRGLLIHHEKEHPGSTRSLSLLSKNVLLK